MKRNNVVVDRLICGSAGAALVAVGLAGAAWARGDLPRDSALTIRQLDSIINAPWWPYALGAAALVLIALGVRALINRRPGRKPDAVALPGSTGTTLLTVDLTSAAEAAAAGLTRHPHVVSATGRCRADRGERVVEIDLKVDAHVDLTQLSAALDGTRRDLATSLDGVSYARRVLISAQRGSARNTRVV